MKIRLIAALTRAEKPVITRIKGFSRILIKAVDKSGALVHITVKFSGKT
jgi:hypothetical protein